MRLEANAPRRSGPWTSWSPSSFLADTHLTNADVVLKEGVRVPLIVGGNVRWLSVPTQLPLPPVTGFPFTVPPRIPKFAFTEARVPASLGKFPAVGNLPRGGGTGDEPRGFITLT